MNLKQCIIHDRSCLVRLVHDAGAGTAAHVDAFTPDALPYALRCIAAPCARGAARHRRSHPV